MQEHFNENYMESNKYPKADFQGTIANINEVTFSKDGIYNIKTVGKLTIHGVTKDAIVPGTLTVKGNTINVKAQFSILLKDYKIEIPSLVSDKVSNDAMITIESNLNQK